MGNCTSSRENTGAKILDLGTNFDRNEIEDTNQQDYFFKILLLGDSGVGKSSLLSRLTDDDFSMTHISTVGVDFKTITLNIFEKNVKLQIWDTAGQERYRSITQAYYRGAHGVVLIFDLTNRQSLENISKWMSDVNKQAHESTKIVLVGNKVDLVDARMVKRSEATQYAEKLGVPYFETSAKNAENVKLVFETVSQLILKNENKL